MTLIQLKYYIETCRWGNITRAANELHISQPSISAAIKELEEEFGILLFQRVNGRLKITDDGRLFLARAYRLTESADELAKLMRGSINEKKNITIGLTPMIAASFFDEIYGGFIEKYPDTTFDIVEHGSIALHDRLSSREIDMVIAMLSPMDSASFKTHLIKNTEFCLCISKEHPLAKLESVGIPDIKDTPIALLSGNTYHSQVLLNRFEKLGLTPNISIRSNQIQTIRQMVSKGRACTFLLKEAVSSIPNAAAIPFKEPVSVDVALIWSKNVFSNPRAEEFIEYVKLLSNSLV